MGWTWPRDQSNQELKDSRDRLKHHLNRLEDHRGHRCHRGLGDQEHALEFYGSESEWSVFLQIRKKEEVLDRLTVDRTYS